MLTNYVYFYQLNFDAKRYFKILSTHIKSQLLSYKYMQRINLLVHLYFLIL